MNEDKVMEKHPRYWFKRRRYGWGWTPVSLQGWMSLLIYIFVVVSAGFVLPPKPQQPSTSQLACFFTIFFSATILLIVLCHKKGPKPRWRWGSSSSDNAEEDR